MELLNPGLVKTISTGISTALSSRRLRNLIYSSVSWYFTRYIKKLGKIYEVITTIQDYLMEKFFIQVYFDDPPPWIQRIYYIVTSNGETRKGSRSLKPVVMKRFTSHVISGVVNDLVTQ